jgi:hypothetical protein
MVHPGSKKELSVEENWVSLHVKKKVSALECTNYQRTPTGRFFALVCLDQLKKRLAKEVLPPGMKITVVKYLEPNQKPM